MNRRQLVKRSVAALCALAGRRIFAEWPPTPVPKQLLLIPSPEDLLGEESRAGFQSAMTAGFCMTNLPPPKSCPGQVIVIPSARDLSCEFIEALRNSMDHGAWVIWEHAARFGDATTTRADNLLAASLGIEIFRCLPIKSKNYVQYRWPTVTMVRAFHQAMLLNCSAEEVVAEYDGLPVAVKRGYGGGGLIFLGSMLGPGIRAGEPQARQIAQALLTDCHRHRRLFERLNPKGN